MRSRIRPISLLLTTLSLSLIFTHAALAFECTNAGAGIDAPDDGGVGSQTACGNAAVASGGSSTAVGGSATASGTDSTALGLLATASGVSATAVGRGAQASGFNSNAVGTGATASGENSTSVGGIATASGDNNIVLGSFATALTPHTNATALGYLAQIEQSNAMVLGSIPGINSATDYVDVGIGTSMPQAPLHVERANGTARVLVTELEPGPSMPFQGVAQGLVRFELNDEASGKRWRFTNAGNKFAINQVDVPGTEFQVFETGDMLITGVLTENSDRDAKQDIVPVDRDDVLARIAGLPIAEWSYKDNANQRHIGPMAQDFYAAFGLGRNEKGISTLDSSGVALAGIQALAEENTAIRAQYESIRTQNVSMQQQLAIVQAQNESLSGANVELTQRLADLERQQAETQAMMARLLEAQQAQPVLTRSLAN